MGHFPQSFHPGHAGHGKIKQKNVGFELLGQEDGFFPVRGFRDHDEILFAYEQPSQAIAEDRMIVRDDNPDGSSVKFMQCSTPPVVEI
jgi:hypothetical protein